MTSYRLGIDSARVKRHEDEFVEAAARCKERVRAAEYEFDCAKLRFADAIKLELYAARLAQEFEK